MILIASTPVLAQDNNDTINNSTNISQNTNSNANQEFDNFITEMESHLNFDNNKITIEDIPTNIINQLGPDGIQKLQDGITKINTLAEQNEVKINENGSITTLRNRRGGTNSQQFYWWGVRNKMSTSTANTAARDLGRATTISGGVALVSSYFSIAIGAISSGITALWFNQLGNDIQYYNSGHTRGICVDLTWVGFYSIERQ